MFESESFLLNMSFDLLIQWCNVSICSNGYEFRFFKVKSKLFQRCCFTIKNKLSALMLLVNKACLKMKAAKKHRNLSSVEK